MTEPGPSGAEDPEAALARHAEVLIAGIDEALPGWVIRCVELRMTEWAGAVPDDVQAAAERAADEARAELSPQVAEVLRADIDDQPVPPLSILRRGVRYPTRVLADAGVPHVVRDELDERMHPDDVYGLAPANFADLDPRLHEPGLAWGAAKAFVHLRRRKAEGRR